MDAVVLVGGEGTRLRPLTYDVPKQMLPVVDRPMIEHVVEWLATHGVDRVVLSLGYRPDAFLAAYPDGVCAGVEMAYAIEAELLDTAGAIRFAARSAGVEGTFIVLNGDVLSDFDVGSLVARHRASGATGTIQLTPVEDPSAFGVVPTDDSGRVVAFIEKPPPGTAPTNLINAGCYVLEPSVLDLIPDGRRVSIERETFPALVERGTLFAMGSDTYWLDTGTPEKFLQASLDVLDGRRTERSLPRAPEVVPGVRSAAPAAALAGVRPPGYVGAGANIDAAAEVSRSVVLDGAVVSAGARVSGSILMAGCTVGAGAVVESSILGTDSTVGEGSSVVAFSVVGAGAAVAPGVGLSSARHPAP